MKKTYAELVRDELLERGSVLIGSSALNNGETKNDIDIATTWDIYLDVLYSNNEILHRNNGIMTSHKNDYSKNSKTLWNGVETLKFKDGSKIDILFYYWFLIPIVSDVINYMIKNKEKLIKNKKLRVETYENKVCELFYNKYNKDSIEFKIQQKPEVVKYKNYEERLHFKNVDGIVGIYEYDWEKFHNKEVEYKLIEKIQDIDFNDIELLWYPNN